MFTSIAMKTNQVKKIGDWRLPPKCIACGAAGSYVRGRISTEKVCHGETFLVEHAHWKCKQCGMGILGPDEANEAVRATVSAYRSKHGLLTPEDLKNARSVAGWSQLDLAERTSLGIATIKRLETGTTVQTEANDQLLRRVLGIANSPEIKFVVRNRECVHSPIPDCKTDPHTVFHPPEERTPDWTCLEETLAC